MLKFMHCKPTIRKKGLGYNFCYIRLYVCYPLPTLFNVSKERPHICRSSRMTPSQEIRMSKPFSIEKSLEFS